MLVIPAKYGDTHLDRISTSAINRHLGPELVQLSEDCKKQQRTNRNRHEVCSILMAKSRPDPKRNISHQDTACITSMLTSRGVVAQLHCWDITVPTSSNLHPTTTRRANHGEDDILPTSRLLLHHRRVPTSSSQASQVSSHMNRIMSVRGEGTRQDAMGTSSDAILQDNVGFQRWTVAACEPEFEQSQMMIPIIGASVNIAAEWRHSD
ncbi:hypothetical protein V8F06_009231 [Rhypophila decipiens]